MENKHKSTKEKLSKVKLINKKAISAKNSFFSIKPSIKFSHNNKNKSLNFHNFTTKEKNLIIQKNLKKYNTSIKKYNKYITNAIIFDQRNHKVTVFKNYLIWDDVSEFLKRYYKGKEIFSRLPTIAEYYEKYTLFSPNYFGNDGLIIVIMLKFLKRKKKYLKYLEEKEDEKDEKTKNKKNNINQDFEPLIKHEVFTKTKTLFSSILDVSKNTLELTNYDNEFNYIDKFETKRKSTNKIITEKNVNSLKNSMSFEEIFDDLSSHFSILINNNDYKDYIQKPKKIPIKSLANKAKLIKKVINQQNNNYKKLGIKNIKQKSISRKDTSNKQQNESKNENNIKSKDYHKADKFKPKITSKKLTLVKENKGKEKEKEKNKELNKKEKKEKIIINKDIKNNPQQILQNNSNKPKENMISKNITNNKNISISNNNLSKTNNIIKKEDKSNVMNTITNIKSQFFSLGKLVKNKKQRSAIKKVNIKSLNLVNLNQNLIPNLKKIVNPKKERRIIFPRNANNIYNNNTNKLNSIKGENFEQIKLLTDRNKENITLVNNTNETSKLIKLNDNIFLYNNQNGYLNNRKGHMVISQKISKLVKRKNISLNADNMSNTNNLSTKEINRNSLIYKNENNAIININNLNNIHYKKNSVLRQFNSKNDFNLNNKNNLLYNYNNISSNSMNSSSSSSLNNINKKRYKLSNNAVSQNSNSNNKIRKSLQKINLNLNLQINFNINIDKKSKKLILAKKLNNRIFKEINNKNNKLRNNKDSNSNSKSKANVPFTQRCYYKVDNKDFKVLGNYRSSSSNAKKKKTSRINI